MNNDFYVFISWSDAPSREIAEYVHKLLTNVFAVNRNIKYFLSSSDNEGIDKGEKFQKKLDDSLFKSDYGIIILTKNNTKRPWIMFEAGSLAKNVKIARVCPILFDIDEIEKNSPLFPFQYAKFSKKEFDSLFQSILKAFNNSEELKENEKTSLTDLLDKHWGEFENNVKNLLEDPQYKMRDLSDSLFNDGLSYGNLLYLEREKYLEELIKNMYKYSGSRIIIFGGIPTIIRDAAREFAKWIIDNEDSQLFFCYENEELINIRKEDLTDKAYDELDKDRELINRKRAKLEEFKKYFQDELGAAPNKRIHFIELSERLSGYVTIKGNELFYTPLLHKRSSLTFTFKLKNKQMLDVIDYMISKTTDGSLKQELEILGNEL
jgi:hypothetical protein